MTNTALTESAANDSGGSPNAVEAQRLEKLQQQLKDIKEQVKNSLHSCAHTLRQNLKIYFKFKN